MTNDWHPSKCCQPAAHASFRPGIGFVCTRCGTMEHDIMTHHIGISVECDQAEIDRLAGLLATWANGVSQRGYYAARAHRIVHNLTIDGKPLWSGGESVVTKVPP